MPLIVALLTLPQRGLIAFQEREPLTFDDPVGSLPVVDDARWSAAFTGSSWGALAVWVVLLIVLQLVSWPLVRRVFTRFPDRGWPFARLVSLLLAGYLTWLLASLHIIRFQAIWAAVSLVLVGLASLLIRRSPERHPARGMIHRNPLAISAEVVFWMVFGLFLLFRAINPDSYHPYWGGEKPMEFAHLNAILRSAHFPPVDPWYSGGFINYYYYGTYLVAYMIKLTGIPVEYAFNLAQPTFPALLASTSFSMAAALGKRLTGSTFGALIAGLLGTAFAQFAGNLVVASRLITGLFDDWGPVDGWGFWVWSPSRALPTPDRGINITEFPYFGALYADLHPHVIAMPFTMLLLALAWQMAASWRSFVLTRSQHESTKVTYASIAAPMMITGLALGSLFMINAWDMPMYAIITGVAIIMTTAGIRLPWRRAAIVLLLMAGTGLLAFLVALPFTLHYVALFGDIGTVTDDTPLLGVEAHLGAQLILITLGASALMLQRTEWSRASQTAFGGGAVLLLVFFLLMQWVAIENGFTSSVLAERGIVMVIAAFWIMSAWSAASSHGTLPSAVVTIVKVALLPVSLGVIWLLSTDRPVLGLYAVIGLTAGVMWLTLPRPSERFVMMMVAGATLLGASLELIYLVDNLDGGAAYRMNTIFKFYNQIWNLLGVATGVLAGRAIWDIVVHSDEPLRPDAEVPSRALAWITAALVVPITLASLTYAVMATPVRIDTRITEGVGLSLNAYEWMEYGEIPITSGRLDRLSYEDDLSAINWLNENVAGTPVIAEAAFGTYRCNGSRFSIHTGLPAVIGWVNHQTQQRSANDLWAREQALRDLYTLPDTARQIEIIDRYNIEYVIVGETERHYPNPQPSGDGCVDTGSPEAIASLESLDGDRLESVFSSGSTTIYRVLGD